MAVVADEFGAEMLGWVGNWRKVIARRRECARKEMNAVVEADAAVVVVGVVAVAAAGAARLRLREREMKPSLAARIVD